jgi:hypothetical protein
MPVDSTKPGERGPNYRPSEEVILDISVNGDDYNGEYKVIFTEPLDVYRIVPMAGPLTGNTSIKLYGSGYDLNKEDVHIRWGVLDTEK